MPSFREGVKAGLDERGAQRQAAGLCRKQPHRPKPKLCGQRFRRPWEMRVTLGDTITGHKQTASNGPLYQQAQGRRWYKSDTSKGPPLANLHWIYHYVSTQRLMKTLDLNRSKPEVCWVFIASSELCFNVTSEASWRILFWNTPKASETRYLEDK